MIRWIRLGLRLSIGAGRVGVVRTVLMGTGSAIGTVMVFATLAGASVNSAQLNTEVARTPSYGTESDASPLRLAERYDAIGTRALVRVAVGGATSGSPLPPGLAAYPGVGEAVVSPALADLIQTDQRAQNRFPQRIVGEIAPAGIKAPDELYAYVGVPADDPFLGGQVVTGFRDGTKPWTIGPDVGDAFTQERVAAFAFALFVLVPFGVFLATCARLSASTRDRRIAALRLLGVSARQSALVNAIETGVVASVGALLGYGTFRALVPWSEHWHIGRLHWYAKDIALPAGVVLAVLGLVVLFGVVVAVASTRPARVSPLTIRRQAPSRRPSLWLLVPLLAGLTLSIVAARLDAGGGPDGPDPRIFAAKVWLYLGGTLVAGLGLPLSLGWFGWGIAGLMRRLPRATPSWDLTAARLRHAPGIAPRLVGALAAVLYVVGMGSLGAAAIGERFAFEINPGNQLYTTNSQDKRLIDEIRTLPGVEVADIGSAGSTVNGEFTSVLLADCADITALFTIEDGSCEDGLVYRTVWTFGQPVATPAGTEIVTEDGWRLTAPDSTLTMSLRHHLGFSAGVLVTRQAPQAAGLTLADNHATVIVPDRATAEVVAALVSARTPANMLVGGFVGERGLDAALLGTLLTAGLVVSLTLGIATFVVAAADRRLERRREHTTLAVVGASRRLAASTEIAFNAIPLALGVLAATGATIVMAQSLAWLLDVDTDAVVEVAIPVLSLGALALAVGLVLVIAPALLTPKVTASSLRRE